MLAAIVSTGDTAAWITVGGGVVLLVVGGTAALITRQAATISKGMQESMSHLGTSMDKLRDEIYDARERLANVEGYIIGRHVRRPDRPDTNCHGAD